MREDLSDFKFLEKHRIIVKEHLHRSAGVGGHVGFGSVDLELRKGS